MEINGPVLFYGMEYGIDEMIHKDEGLMKFLTTQKALELLNKANVISCWDFNTSLGDTIRDKYDSLFIKIVEITSVLLRNGGTGFFWCVMSPEVFSIMDSATSDKTITKKEPQQPMGLLKGELTDMGVMGRRWRCLVDSAWPTNQLLIGCGHKENLLDQYARLSIANFIV